jgi:hypothetical protein
MSARKCFILGVLVLAFGGTTEAAHAECRVDFLHYAYGACHSECDSKNRSCQGLQAALNSRNLENIHSELSTCISRAARDATIVTTVEACFNGSPDEKNLLIVEGCSEFGCTTPQPSKTAIEFRPQPMTTVDAAKDVVVADFTLTGDGNFNTVTLDFTRDGTKVYDMSTYAVGFDHVDGKLHLRVTTYDKQVKDVHDHKYTVQERSTS